MPKVSVIIPNYNHAKYLIQRIESILSQTYTDFEIIILDDRSTDNSKEIIESYRNHPKVSKIVYSDVNGGSSFKQWNKGVSLATGDWVWIAESDDVAEPGLLAALVSKTGSNNNLGIVYCQSYRLNADDKVTGTWNDWTRDLDENLFQKDFNMKGMEFIERFLINRNTIPNASAVLFKKKCFLDVGGADEDNKYSADWFLWLKILLKNNIAFVPSLLNYFRYHDQSVIAKAVKDRDKGRFYEIYDRRMRSKFHDVLLDVSAEGYNVSSIIDVNKRYISQEDAREGLHYVRNNKAGGWILLIKGSIKIKSLVYIKSALKHLFLRTVPN